jgi:hypothetical protein
MAVLNCPDLPGSSAATYRPLRDVAAHFGTFEYTKSKPDSSRSLSSVS